VVVPVAAMAAAVPVVVVRAVVRAGATRACLTNRFKMGWANLFKLPGASAPEIFRFSSTRNAAAGQIGLSHWPH
jgi:hypothetical protein